jgi:ATP adenylyltransferase
MKNCEFCNLDKTKITNTIIEEYPNFYIKVSLGALVEGYVLIISKRHICSMRELNQEEKIEYINIIKKYRDLFFNKYDQFPIIFEHGTSRKENVSASSIVHAHTHIVNHNFKNEKSILERLKLKQIDDYCLERNDKSYIFYMNSMGNQYITYEFEPISQMMRIYIAKDLEIQNKYDWKKYPFTENVIQTIKKLLTEKNKN